MYVPAAFAEQDAERLHAFMRAHPLAALVLHDTAGFDCNHLPMEFDLDTAEPRLRCHVARANPAWQRLAAAPAALVVFSGPQHYVSPGWYPSKARDGRAVPTWNYVAVHAEVRATPFDEPARLRAHLEALSRRHEAGRSPPWTLDEAPAGYIDGLLRGIVGLELQVQRLVGKRKASQNRSAEDRAGVAAGLAADGVDAATLQALLQH